MEKEGLKRSLQFLEESGLTVGCLVTDRHPQIQKFVREEKPAVIHYYDVWHVAKSMTNYLLKKMFFSFFVFSVLYETQHYFVRQRHALLKE